MNGVMRFSNQSHNSNVTQHNNFKCTAKKASKTATSTTICERLKNRKKNSFEIRARNELDFVASDDWLVGWLAVSCDERSAAVVVGRVTILDFVHEHLECQLASLAL